LRFAPRAADVENGLGCKGCDDDRMEEIVLAEKGVWGRAMEVEVQSERRENEAERVENLEV